MLLAIESLTTLPRSESDSQHGRGRLVASCGTGRMLRSAKHVPGYRGRRAPSKSVGTRKGRGEGKKNAGLRDA